MARRGSPQTFEKRARERDKQAKAQAKQADRIAKSAVRHQQRHEDKLSEYAPRPRVAVVPEGSTPAVPGTPAAPAGSPQTVASSPQPETGTVPVSAPVVKKPTAAAIDDDGYYTPAEAAYVPVASTAKPKPPPQPRQQPKSANGRPSHGTR
jgi:hypothetical protein